MLLNFNESRFASSLNSSASEFIKEIYKGEIKADKDQTATWTNRKTGDVALQNSCLIYFALSFIHLLGVNIILADERREKKIG